MIDLTKPVSGRMFAKMVGVASDNAVRKAVERQSIIKGYDSSTKKFFPIIAAREWGKEILPEFLQASGTSIPENKTEAKPVKVPKPEKKKPDPTTADEFVDEMMHESLPAVSQEDIESFDDENPGTFGDHSPKTEAERRTAIYKAKMAELAYKEKKGDMIPRHKMRVLFEYGTQIRTSMLSIPDRVIDNILAAADDRQVAKNILIEEIYNTLNLLADPEKFEL